VTNEIPWRICVLGATGSGKTTLARRIAHRLEIPCIELDALHWGPDWTPFPLERVRAETARAVKGDAWVVDGGHGTVREIVWPRAELVVWLDYSLPLILWRTIRRTLHRCVVREELWNGNRETFRRAFLSRKSVILFALRRHWGSRRECTSLLKRPEYHHLTIVRLRSPRSTEAWLAKHEEDSRGYSCS